MRKNAAELQDGIKVFHSKNGSIYTEDGKRLNDELARDLAFSDIESSWVDFKAEKEAFDTATRQAAHEMAV